MTHSHALIAMSEYLSALSLVLFTDCALVMHGLQQLAAFKEGAFGSVVSRTTAAKPPRYPVPKQRHWQRNDVVHRKESHTHCRNRLLRFETTTRY